MYQIETPKGEKWDKVRNMVNELQNKGLDLGHGFKKQPENITDEDIRELITLTEDISLEIDKVLGIDCLLGEW